MLKKTCVAMMIALMAFSVFVLTPDSARGNNVLPVALSGQISSQKEGLMEGVVVGAKKEGSTITINVMTDEKGRYSFPGSKLEPGHYTLKTRAAGYDLDSPKAVDVVAGKTAKANLKLKPAENLSAQLSDAEWLLSIPGTEDQKKFLLGCNGCHTIDRIVKANKTAKVTDFPIPELKKGFPLGTLDLQLDKEENVWVSLMYQGGIAKFDRKTEKFQIYPVPKEWQGNHTQQSMVSPANSHVDGKVWTNNQDTHSIYRVDLATGQYENSGEFQIPGASRSINAYGIPSDKDNNLYLLEFGSNMIGRIDAKTKDFKVYQTLTANSRPRRGRFDQQNRLWFAEYGANGIGMLDPQTEKIQEWTLPIPWSAPYHVVPDKNGEVWVGSMWTDRITRFNPKTSQFTN